MRIRHRLLLGFLAIVVIFMIFGGYVFVVWQSMNADTEELDRIYETSVEQSQQELDLTLHLALILEESRAELLDHTTGDPDAASRIEATFDEFDGVRGELISIIEADDNADTEVVSALTTIEERHEVLRAVVGQITSETVDGDAARSDSVSIEVADDLQALESEILTIEEQIERRAEASRVSFDDVIHEIEDRVRNLQSVMIAVLGIAIVVAFTIGYRTAQSISRPIETLSTAAIGIERGDYDLDDLDSVTARSDEIGRFAKIFQSMAAQIRAREASLRAKISALRIEVDRTKSSEQVSEIAETDFFKDLQSKAREMRAAAKPEI